ncbi:MAG TPA: nucleotide kinase domain-containing protein [Candidatus Paceibacterota bacterium]|nr:nucleotide kinase domain-containing protein [Candidatus Paceibacterota bacterium]
MELPAHLKALYRHWPLHLAYSEISSDLPTGIDLALLSQIESFTHERINIWKKKVSGAQPPYTTDPILDKYRFCNIFREFDRQTIAFHELLNPLRDNFPLWLLNMFYLRMTASIETPKVTGLLSYDAAENAEFLKRLLSSPRPRFGTPYIFPVSTIMRSNTPTREEFIAYHLPAVMKSVAKEIETWNKVSVFDGVKKITPLFGYNINFLWTEVLIDVAYQYPEHINLFAQFPIGPGSLPTMKHLGNAKDPSLLVVDLSQYSLDVGITFNGEPLRLSAENWEGIGCEFRKYTNLSLGNGRKRLYK